MVTHRKSVLKASIALMLILGLMVVQVFALFPVASVQAQDSGKIDEYSCWNYSWNNGKAQIEGFMPNYEPDGSYAIPATLGGFPVTRINSIAFKLCSHITSITIPETVTSIGWAAFEGCSGLTSITIPEGVANIELSAFSDCSGLTSITFNSPTTKIGYYAVPHKTKIIGYDPSTAKDYAAENGNTFEAIGGTQSETPQSTNSNSSSTSTPVNNSTSASSAITTNPGSSSSSSSSETSQGSGGAVFTFGSNNYSLNGVTQRMDVSPYSRDGRTFLPIRYVAYALGIEDNNITWDGATQSVTLIKGDTTVQLYLGSKHILVDDVSLPMDVASESNNGRICLPIALVAQAFGASANWDATSQSVIITAQASNSNSSSEENNIDEKLALYKQAQIDCEKKWGVKPLLGPPYGEKKNYVDLVRCDDYDASAVENITVVGWYGVSEYRLMKYKHTGPGQWTFIAWMECGEMQNNTWQAP